MYQYYYDGHREYRTGGDHGVEFVFTDSSDRKNGRRLRCWSAKLLSARANRRTSAKLSLTECYAVGKIALFQAFDERPDTAQLRDEVRVRNADVEGIIETLDL